MNLSPGYRLLILTSFLWSLVAVSPSWADTDTTEEEDLDRGVEWTTDIEEDSEIEVEELAASARGPKYTLEKVTVFGNRKTMRPVILQYVEIQPGEDFSADDPRIERAKYRLLASGLFHDVELSLKRGKKRGGVNLEILVRERNTIVVEDLVFGLSEISAYGSLDVAERSFLGSGDKISAAAVFSKDQYGYRLRFSDDDFMFSDFGIHVEGLYSHARDYFGHGDICAQTCEDEPKTEEPDNLWVDDKKYVTLKYDRAGMRLGLSHNLLRDIFLIADYRYETIRADVPPAASQTSFGQTTPIVFGHLLPGHSSLSSLIFAMVRDTRDSPLLASTGTRTLAEIEVSSEIFGSSYDFSKFTISHDQYFHLGRGHSIKLGLFAGMIMGDAPFFNQFFVGDFSAVIPSRVLEMNFSHLQPSILNTSVEEMRYEDLAGSLNVEYSLPLYRGHGFFYGINAFAGFGVYALTSKQYLRVDSEKYSGFRKAPLDLTADLGIRVDTEIGMFVFSLANLFRMIPVAGKQAAEE